MVIVYSRTLSSSASLGTFADVNAYVERLEQPIPLSVKMEDLLNIVLAQRRKIAAAASLSHKELAHHQATPSQMKDMINAWRKNVSSWMSTRSLDQYQGLRDQKRNQDANQFAHKRFATYCFQISGCRFLLKKLIELPIVRYPNSVAQPA